MVPDQKAVVAMVIRVTQDAWMSGKRGCACFQTHVQAALRLPCVPHEGGLVQFDAPTAAVPDAGPSAGNPCTAHPAECPSLLFIVQWLKGQAGSKPVRRQLAGGPCCR